MRAETGGPTKADGHDVLKGCDEGVVNHKKMRDRRRRPVDIAEARKKLSEQICCPICLEPPHNAVLLICSSLRHGCRTFLCDTSYRHSNCFDHFRKTQQSTRVADTSVVGERNEERREDTGNNEAHQQDARHGASSLAELLLDGDGRTGEGVGRLTVLDSRAESHHGRGARGGGNEETMEEGGEEEEEQRAPADSGAGEAGHGEGRVMGSPLSAVPAEDGRLHGERALGPLSWAAWLQGIDRENSTSIGNSSAHGLMMGSQQTPSNRQTANSHGHHEHGIHAVVFASRRQSSGSAAPARPPPATAAAAAMTQSAPVQATPAAVAVAATVASPRVAPSVTPVPAGGHDSPASVVVAAAGASAGAGACGVGAHGDAAGTTGSATLPGAAVPAPGGGGGGGGGGAVGTVAPWQGSQEEHAGRSHSRREGSRGGGASVRVDGSRGVMDGTRKRGRRGRKPIASRSGGDTGGSDGSKSSSSSSMEAKERRVCRHSSSSSSSSTGSSAEEGDGP